MKRLAAVIALCVVLVLIVAPLKTPVAAQGQVVGPTDLTVLPIPEPRVPDSTVFGARNATPPPRFEVNAPANTPNVLIVLIDDMGFGMSEAFGGPIHMPAVTRLANNGAALQPVPYHGALIANPVQTPIEGVSLLSR